MKAGVELLRMCFSYVEFSMLEFIGGKCSMVAFPLKCSYSQFRGTVDNEVFHKHR